MHWALAAKAMLRNKLLALLGIVFLLQACSDTGQMEKIRAFFPEKKAIDLHFAPILQSDPEFSEAKELDDLFVTMLDLEGRTGLPRAAFRFEMGQEGLTGLVCLVPPGESSNHWGKRLLVYDLNSSEYAPWENLAEANEDCTVSVTESWVIPGVKNENAKLVRKTMTYALPNPEIEGCEKTIRPNVEEVQLDFGMGAWLLSKNVIPSEKYKMKEAAKVESAFAK